MSSKENQKRYVANMHAMQTGVAMMMNYDSKETEPKHLRVGINSALIDSGTIIKLLIDKGIVTEEELMKELADMAERDVQSYEAKLKDITGGNITLR